MKRYSLLVITALLFAACEGPNGPENNPEEEEVVLEAVDLGLSVKWANLNVGATRPENAGDYFAWGEVERKSWYSWNTYQWCNGDEYYMTKYNSLGGYGDYGGAGVLDGKIFLDEEDDVATVIDGKDWRMPTLDEWFELRDNCTWTWTKQGEMAGYLVKGKKSGYTDKSIFLPAAGGYDEESFSSSGTLGCYWTVSLYTTRPSHADCGAFKETQIGYSVYPRYCGFPVRPVSGPRADVVRVESISLDITEINMSIGDKVDLTATVTPANAHDKGVVWSLLFDTPGVAVLDFEHIGKTSAEGKAVATVIAKGAGIATLVATAADGGAKAICRFSVKAAGPELVDLGLSVKWAAWNIGAEKPEDSGEFFAWGMVRPNEPGYDYYWNGYEFSNHSECLLTKYNTWTSAGAVDSRMQLVPEEDAATERYGDKWRTPTLAELYELRDNCNWTWTTLEGVNGQLVTSNVPGYTDKSIFLPAAGYRWYSYPYDANTTGEMWSSMLYSPNPFYALAMRFDEEGVKIGGDPRCAGFPIRPVFGDPAPQASSISLAPQALALEIGETASLTCSADIVMWGSSDISVANVSDGVVSARASGSATIMATTIDGEQTAVCEVSVKPATPEAVDLGLSVKWAAFNLGASGATQAGHYYAWGEPEHKSTFGPENYKWNDGYGNAVLAPEDDAATVAYGGTWRIPTKEEWQELFDNCSITVAVIDEVEGCRLTSNKEGYTDKFIFLPYAGSFYSYYAQGYWGNYWTSSRDLKGAAFDSSLRLVSEYSYLGFLIRPVCE